MSVHVSHDDSSIKIVLGIIIITIYTAWQCVCQLLILYDYTVYLAGLYRGFALDFYRGSALHYGWATSIPQIPCPPYL